MELPRSRDSENTYAHMNADVAAVVVSPVFDQQVSVVPFAVLSTHVADKGLRFWDPYIMEDRQQQTADTTHDVTEQNNQHQVVCSHNKQLHSRDEEGSRVGESAYHHSTPICLDTFAAYPQKLPRTHL